MKLSLLITTVAAAAVEAHGIFQVRPRGFSRLRLVWTILTIAA